MSKFHIGAQIDRAPGRKYSAALRFAELAPRAPLPRPGTLASMRADLPADFVFALRAPRSSIASSRGSLRMDADLEAGLNWVIAAADSLQARAIVFNTPADLTPGARSRDLLREYVARLPRNPERHYVWLPQGVWEVEDAASLCAELGIVFGFDPLESKAPSGEVTYATLRALGHRRGFSPAALSDALVTTLSHSPREAFLAVDAERAFDIARRLNSILADAAGAEAILDEDGEGSGVRAAIAADASDSDEQGLESDDDEDADDEDSDEDSDDEDSDDEDEQDESGKR